MAANVGPFGPSDSESSDDSVIVDECPDLLAKEEAALERQMSRLEEKRKELRARRESAEHMRSFLADTKMPKGATPGSGSCSTASTKEATEDKKRKAPVHDLRASFEQRTTLGRAPDWPATPSKKPSPIRAPAANDPRKPAPTVKGAKYRDIELDAEKFFDAAANSIQLMVNDIMRKDGIKKVNETGFFGFIGQKPPSRVPDSMPHEKELEGIVIPEKLQSGEWAAKWEKWDGPKNENVPLSVMLKTLCQGVRAAHAKLDLMKDIQHLHSVANVHIIKASFITRLFCVAAGPEKQAITAKLVSSLRSVILAADPELKRLPFKSLGVMTDFFRSSSRVTKLALFVLNYVEYGPSFNATLLNVLISTDLQNDVYWPSECSEW